MPGLVMGLVEREVDPSVVGGDGRSGVDAQDGDAQDGDAHDVLTK